MALRAADGAELVKVGVHVALVAVAVGPFIDPFDLVAVDATDIVMDPFKFKTCKLFMVELPRLPVALRMAGTAFLFK